jgi:hypothetical protein
MNNKIIHIRHDGSVEHYYHFLLGFMFPLVDWYIRQTSPEDVKIRNCSIMDHLIQELTLSKVIIAPKKELVSECCESLVGFDNPSKFKANELRQISTWIKFRLKKSIEKYYYEIFGTTEKQKIVMINRSNPNPFYMSEESEVKGSGSLRRSIPNFQELVQAIQSDENYVIATYLEEKPLAYQIALFEGASCIIAQHGAALGNIVFANKKTRVIEIIPEDLHYNSKNLFALLSSCLELRYSKIHQQSLHAPVCVDDLLSVFK